MSSVVREFIDGDSGQIHIRKSGRINPERPALVCLHMTPQSGQSFETFMKLAGSDRLVIAPDCPGYGDSQPFENGKTVSIENYAAAIWNALDIMGISEVELLGYHTGSKVAIEMTSQRPKQVLSVFCISLSTMTPEELAKSDVAFSPLNAAELSGWFGKIQSYYDPKLPSEVLQKKYAISMIPGNNFHLGFAASFNYNEFIIQKLKALNNFVTLICPNDDLVSITPKAANYIKNCSLVERPKWLPGFLELKPDEVLKILNKSVN